MQASRILLLAAALAILCSVTNAQFTFTPGNADKEPIWKCDKTKVVKISNKEAQDQCQGFCDRVTKTVNDLEVEFFWRSAVVRVRARVLSSHPYALSHRNRTKIWEKTIKKSFVFKRQLLCGRCVECQYFWESDCELLQPCSTQHALCCSSIMLQCGASAYCSVLQQHTAVCCRCCCDVLQHFAALQLLLCLNACSWTNSTTQASNSREQAKRLSQQGVVSSQ